MNQLSHQLSTQIHSHQMRLCNALPVVLLLFVVASGRFWGSPTHPRIPPSPTNYIRTMANYAYYDQMDAYHAQQAVANNYHSPYAGEENHQQHGSRTFYASGHKRFVRSLKDCTSCICTFSSHSRRPESPSGPRVFRQLNGTTEAATPQAYSNSKRYLYSNAVQAPDGSRHDRTVQQVRSSLSWAIS